MLKIGVLGAGHLGKIHIRLLKELDNYQLIGFYDPNTKVASKLAIEYGLKHFSNIQQLIDEVDVVDIVTPTLSHYDCAVKALKSGKHIFIEKPVTNTLDEARSLMALAKETNLQVQVGHVERFNPAYLAVKDLCNNPMFIETHRLAQFNPRGTDVSVILDLMIHDIDIILSLVKSPVKNINASGVAVASKNPDITNARIEFENGCVANLTASRISMKNMRKTRLFQKDAYISIDFFEKEAEIVRMKDVDANTELDPFAMLIDVDTEGNQKQIYFEKPKTEALNAIKEELRTFALAIENNTQPIVTLEDGYRALDVATQIYDKVSEALANKQ